MRYAVSVFYDEGPECDSGIVSFEVNTGDPDWKDEQAAEDMGRAIVASIAAHEEVTRG